MAAPARAPLTSRLAGFGTTIFAEMSALAARTGAINLGQGFPDTDGPAEVHRGGGRGDARRPQPVPARPRHPGAARRDRRAPAPLLRHRARPRRRGAGHDRRDRGDRRRAARAVRARRRGRDVRALLRLLRGLHRDGRRRAAAGHAAPAGLRGRPRRARRRVLAAHAARAAQLAAQPDGQGLHARRAGARRRALPRARRARRHRRGLRAPRRSTAASTCRSHAARHGRRAR